MEVKEIHFGCKKILKNLFRQKRIGGKHIPESICLKWIKHLPKYDHKQAIKDWELCKKESLILTKPKPSDLHVFLIQKS